MFLAIILLCISHTSHSALNCQNHNIFFEHRLQVTTPHKFPICVNLTSLFEDLSQAKMKLDGFETSLRAFSDIVEDHKVDIPRDIINQTKFLNLIYDNPSQQYFGPDFVTFVIEGKASELQENCQYLHKSNPSNFPNFDTLYDRMKLEKALRGTGLDKQIIATKVLGNSLYTTRGVLVGKWPTEKLKEKLIAAYSPKEGIVFIDPETILKTLCLVHVDPLKTIPFEKENHLQILLQTELSVAKMRLWTENVLNYILMTTKNAVLTTPICAVQEILTPNIPLLKQLLHFLSMYQSWSKRFVDRSNMKIHLRQFHQTVRHLLTTVEVESKGIKLALSSDNLNFIHDSLKRGKMSILPTIFFLPKTGQDRILLGELTVFPISGQKKITISDILPVLVNDKYVLNDRFLISEGNITYTSPEFGSFYNCETFPYSVDKFCEFNPPKVKHFDCGVALLSNNDSIIKAQCLTKKSHLDPFMIKLPCEANYNQVEKKYLLVSNKFGKYSLKCNDLDQPGEYPYSPGNNRISLPTGCSIFDLGTKLVFQIVRNISDVLDTDTATQSLEIHPYILIVSMALSVASFGTGIIVVFKCVIKKKLHLENNDQQGPYQLNTLRKECPENFSSNLIHGGMSC